jgi:hypothetical protein
LSMTTSTAADTDAGTLVTEEEEGDFKIEDLELNSILPRLTWKAGKVRVMVRVRVRATVNVSFLTITLT